MTDALRGFAVGLLIASSLWCCDAATRCSAEDRVRRDAAASADRHPPSVADAHPGAAPGHDEAALLLARACAGETAWDALEECAAIGYVLLRRGWRYSAALRPDRRRAWLAELDASGAEPASWPPHLDWSRWRPRWLALLEHAGRIVRGEVEPPCRADHFGGAMDAHRAWRAGWRQVHCGRVRNWYWVVR